MKLDRFGWERCGRRSRLNGENDHTDTVGEVIVDSTMTSPDGADRSISGGGQSGLPFAFQGQSKSDGPVGRGLRP